MKPLYWVNLEHEIVRAYLVSVAFGPLRGGWLVLTVDARYRAAEWPRKARDTSPTLDKLHERQTKDNGSNTTNDE